MSHLPNIAHTAGSEAAMARAVRGPGTYTVYISVRDYSREKSYQGYLEPVKSHIYIWLQASEARIENISTLL